MHPTALRHLTSRVHFAVTEQSGALHQRYSRLPDTAAA